MTGDRPALAPGAWIDVRSALELLPCGKSLLYLLLGQRQIRGIRVAAVGSRRGRWLIEKASIAAYIERQLAAAGPREVKLDPDLILRRIRRARRGA